MLVATFSLTNCTEELENPVPEVEKYPYSIYANASEDTKTVNDGNRTKWSEGDELTVFYKKAGESSYSSNIKFTINDAENGKFSTEDLGGALASTNDWYALYPYVSRVGTPENSSNGYTPVGSEHNKAQTQTGNGSMAHIAGQNYPMWGYAPSVSSENLPEIGMTHLSSLIRVSVTNNLDTDLTVSSVSFTAPEDIVGTYFIDFSSTTPKFVGSGENYVSKTANLTVTGGEAIAKGGKADFYLAVKPFTASAGQTLTLAVNGEEKTYTVSKDAVFSPGKIRTIPFTCETVLATSTVADVLAGGESKTVKTEGLVVATYNKGFLLSDETGKILVYEEEGLSVNVGDQVEVLGLTSIYGGLIQITTPTVTVKSSGNTVTHPEPTILDATAFDAMLDATAISYIKYTGTLAVSGSYYNVTVDGASTAIGSVQYPLTSLGLADMNGKTITVEGYFVGVSGTKSKYVNTMAVKVTEEASTEPDPEPEPESGFALVTNVSELKAGDEIVIVAHNSNVALSTTQNSNNRGQADVKKTANGFVVCDNGVQVLTLEDGNKEGTFAFNTGSGYLYAASSGSNHLKTETTLSDNSSWEINIEADGVATIKAKGANTRNWLRYNSGNKIFSCYASGQADVAIYRNNDARIQLDAPTVTGSASGKSVTLQWTSIENANDYEVYKDGVLDGTAVLTTSAGNVTATINNLDLDTEYKFTVFAKAESGSTQYRDSGHSNECTVRTAYIHLTPEVLSFTSEEYGEASAQTINVDFDAIGPITFSLDNTTDFYYKESDDDKTVIIYPKTKNGSTEAERTATLTATDGTVTATMTIKQQMAGASAPQSVELSFSDGSGENQDPISFDDASGVSAVFTAGTHSTKPRWDASCVRFYGTATMTNHLTITAPEGKTITKIVFAMNGSYGLTAVSADSGNIDTSENTWTGSANSVVFTTTAQTRFAGATVTFN